MIDLDSCEKMAIMEAEPMVAEMLQNVPEIQKAEASRKERGVIEGEGDNR